ncbi:TetR/AcrR family transcriptional regulator [Serinibacter salmoneus]|uniref:TetR family transcriptional regulator n=1 Tax=Serinibacter salmoneus TaxID=556530 RepID=A0A2A9CW34_9MICO|nr:TetR/AcrR family transcriptional regulator [Serinibacter salmoneus]PFG18638.1 TetR family transcriptional regulator [Serinibacter salmoneus]
MNGTFIEAARRAQIIDGAIDVIAERGYHAASLASIAARAGVAKSALLYYFDSKDALLRQVLEEVFAEIEKRVEAAVAAQSDAAARLMAYASTYLQMVDEQRRRVVAAVTIAVAHRDADGTPLYLVPEESEGLLLRLVRTGLASGAVRGESARDVASVIEHLLDASITHVQRDPDADLRGITREILRLIRDGVLREE